jgi:CheY-like chemotaxis protein
MSGVDVLLVEDNDDDLHFAVTALKVHVTKNIAVVRDGAEAIDFLFCQGEYADRDCSVQPRLVLLDLKLPKMDGIEVLKVVRADPRTERIPVVMLTSSSRKADLEAAYKAGANSYLVKSVDFNQFSEDVKKVGTYWLELNKN